MSLSWVNDYPHAHDLNVELCLSFSTISFTALYSEFVDVIINCKQSSSRLEAHWIAFTIELALEDSIL